MLCAMNDVYIFAPRVWWRICATFWTREALGKIHIAVSAANTAHSETKFSRNVSWTLI